MCTNVTSALQIGVTKIKYNIRRITPYKTDTNFDECTYIGTSYTYMHIYILLYSCKSLFNWIRKYYIEKNVFFLPGSFS